MERAHLAHVREVLAQPSHPVREHRVVADVGDAVREASPEPLLVLRRGPPVLLLRPELPDELPEARSATAQSSQPSSSRSRHRKRSRGAESSSSSTVSPSSSSSRPSSQSPSSSRSRGREAESRGSLPQRRSSASLKPSPSSSPSSASQVPSSSRSESTRRQLWLSSRRTKRPSRQSSTRRSCSPLGSQASSKRPLNWAPQRNMPPRPRKQSSQAIRVQNRSRLNSGWGERAFALGESPRAPE